MDSYEKKYWIKEDEKIKNFHRSRRMFCYYNWALKMAMPNLEYSHAKWFENEWWLTSDNDEIMNTIMRWIIDKDGDIYFYTWYDFKTNNDIEKIFFKILDTLVIELKLNTEKNIYWWLIKALPWEIWPPAKKFGKIKENFRREIIKLVNENS